MKSLRRVFVPGCGVSAALAVFEEPSGRIDAQLQRLSQVLDRELPAASARLKEHGLAPGMATAVSGE